MALNLISTIKDEKSFHPPTKQKRKKEQKKTWPKRQSMHILQMQAKQIEHLILELNIVQPKTTLHISRGKKSSTKTPSVSLLGKIISMLG